MYATAKTYSYPAVVVNFAYDLCGSVEYTVTWTPEGVGEVATSVTSITRPLSFTQASATDPLVFSIQTDDESYYNTTSNTLTVVA